MSVMFEVFYKAPPDSRHEALIEERVSRFGGRLTCREEPETHGPNNVCLTYEFDDWPVAEQAAQCLREAGEHVEGPMDYGH